MDKVLLVEEIVTHEAFCLVESSNPRAIARIIATRLLAVRIGKEISVSFGVHRKVNIRARIWQGSLQMEVQRV